MFLTNSGSAAELGDLLFANNRGLRAASEGEDVVLATASVIVGSLQASVFTDLDWIRIRSAAVFTFAPARPGGKETVKTF